MKKRERETRWRLIMPIQFASPYFTETASWFHKRMTAAPLSKSSVLCYEYKVLEHKLLMNIPLSTMSIHKRRI